MIEAALILAREIEAAFFATTEAIGDSSNQRALTARVASAWCSLPRRTVRDEFIIFCALYVLIGSFALGSIMYAIENKFGTPRFVFSVCQS